MDKLTQGAARRHIRRLAAPAAVGLFCNTLYNITDAYYAGWIHTDAQAALAFSFPLYFIMLSCCVGLLQAITARTARALGAKRLSRACYVAGQSMILGVLVCVFIWLVLLPATGFLLRLLGAAGQTAIWANDYSSVIYIGSFAFVGAFVLNGILHATGDTRSFRNSIMAATALNVILDPALMFGWFGLPALGVSGIAWATVISQSGCALYLLWRLSRTTLARRWRWVFLRPRGHLLTALAGHAATPTGRMLCINAGFFIITGILGHLDDKAVAAYGIALRLEQLFLLPTIGMEAAMLAYAGQNFGGMQPARVQMAYFYCLKQGWLLSAVGAGVLIILGGWMMSIFNNDAAVVQHGRHYLWMAAVAGPCYVLLNIAGSVFLAAARYGLLLTVNALRLIVVPLIFCWLLAIVLDWGAPGVWLGLLAGNFAAAIFMHLRCLPLLRESAPTMRGG